MNPERIVFGRVTINGDKTSLGRAKFVTLLQRLAQTFHSKEYRGGKLQLIVEISDDPLPVATIMSREDQLTHELQTHMVTDPDEEAFPGVTISRMLQVIETTTYEQYNHICEPSHRVGLDRQTIQSIRDKYAEEFPDCVAHFPLWRDS